MKVQQWRILGMALRKAPDPQTTPPPPLIDGNNITGTLNKNSFLDFHRIFLAQT